MNYPVILCFLPKEMKIEKLQKLLCNLYDKKIYFIHAKALKQAMDLGLKLKKV